MKYLKYFESEKTGLKKNNYMFRNMYETEKGDIKGICKFCEEKTGNTMYVDVADHTNTCPTLKFKD